MLTPDETRRYARHLSLPGFGVAGQEHLKRGSVLCVGAGGLGSPALMYLAAAGVGRLGVVDADVVDESNLQRQLLFGTGDVGRPKAEAAAARLRDLNPLIEVEPHRVRLTRHNAEELVARYDILLDGTDNFPTRYLCNDVAVRLRKPNVHGAIHRFEGQVSVFAPHLGGPCYRCLFPEPPPPGTVPSCAEGGVLGVLPGLVGTLQATEAIKLLAGLGSTLVGRLLHVDALTMRHREIRLRRDPACALCGEAPTLFELPDYPLTCEAAAPVAGLSIAAFAALRAAGSAYTLLDVREPDEVAAMRFPESIAIPLGQLAERLAELPASPRPLVIHCKAGGRSARALALLDGHGVTGDILNLTGGLDAWLAENGPPS
jgi:adenylyltransferase/sulfurtransferase